MKTGSFKRYLRLVGPAVATGIAYIDPGNVASNLTAGSRFGYSLLWVVIFATASAFLVQYLAAKVAIVSGKSLPRLIGESISQQKFRLLYWGQAEIVLIATELAELIGGAIALQILFGLNPFIGVLLVGAVSFTLLSLTHSRFIRPFIAAISGLLLLTVLGFIATLFASHINSHLVVHGFVPHLGHGAQLYVALGIIGATIMPHAIHCHSCMIAELHHDNIVDSKKRLLRWSLVDIAITMGLAGLANIALLIIGASSVFPSSAGDTIAGSVKSIAAMNGHIFSLLFAIGLLTSSLASSAIGGYASNSVMQGLIKSKMDPRVRSVLSILPAVLFLVIFSNSTDVLIGSQVVLTFGLPLTLFPLIRFTASRNLMGSLANKRGLQTIAGLLFVIIVALGVFFLAGLR